MSIKTIDRILLLLSALSLVVSILELFEKKEG